MTENDIRTILSRIVPSIDWSSIASDRSLAELGVDSLDKASAFLEIETFSNVRIPDEIYDRLDSIRSIDEYVNIST